MVVFPIKVAKNASYIRKDGLLQNYDENLPPTNHDFHRSCY